MKFKVFCAKALWIMLGLMIVGTMALAALLAVLEMQLPDVKTLNDVHLQVPLRIYTADGKLMAQFGDQRRTPVTIDEVPKPLINAILATEDARYYQHHGVDPVGVARAAVAVLSSGRKVQGASTITMQVARNFFLTREKTYSRKIREILLAIKIDRELPKDKILELYLNKIYFGNRAYGVAAAAQVYYGKPLGELSLAQMAMMAGLPQAPSKNNPINDPVGAMKRRNHVLSRMLDEGFITQQQFNEASKEPITAKYHDLNVEVQAPYVAEMVREAMVEEYGDTAYEEGLSVYTTIDSRLQTAANKALAKGLIAYDHRHGYKKPTQNLNALHADQWQQSLETYPVIAGLQPAAVTAVSDQSISALLANGKIVQLAPSAWSWIKTNSATQLVKMGDLIYLLHKKDGSWNLEQVPEVEGALISLDPNNGAILALSGGLDYDKSHFNRAIQAERQPGSSFKPFIYSAAFDKNYTLASIINDAPIVQEDSGENGLWRPNNDTHKFYGPTTLRVGLTKSRNIVSIRLLQQLGLPYVLTYIQKFGFDPNALPHSLSLALGTGLVTPLQMATGYAVFANGGYRVEPYFIQEIDGQNNAILFQANPPSACVKCLSNPNLAPAQMPDPMAPRVLTPENAYLMTFALQDVINNGTGRGALVLKRKDLAGKTGTNQETDAWFSGFNSNVVTTVWVGFDNLQSLHEMGAKAALPIWIDYMRVALQDQPEATMPQPQGIVTARIDPVTGLLATPSQSNAIFEVFRADTVPHRYSAGATSPSQPSSNDGTTSVPAADDEAAQHLF